MQLVENVKKYKKIILVGILLIGMPLIEVLIKIIFTYGNYVGTFIRNVSEGGICF